MSYTAAINRANPTAFMFLIDQSRSMNEKMDAGERKSKFVGDVLNKTLLRLMTRCTSADGVRDYFDIGVLTYSGIGVRSGFGEAFSASSFLPMSSLAARPLRIEERKKRVPDGTGGLVDQSIKFPVWLEIVSDGDSPMCEGFGRAAECLVSWCNSHVKSYPPALIHVTGGPSTDGNAEQLAESIRHISTNHGQCLLFNLQVDSSGSASVMFPASEANLPDTYSKMLFRMSSLMPAHLIRPAHEKGYSASSQSRFFGYKAGYEDLVSFFDIGTRISNLLLEESTSPRSSQTSAAPIPRSGTDDNLYKMKSEPTEPGGRTAAAEPASGTAEPVGTSPTEPTNRTRQTRRPGWLQGVRVLGLAVAVVAVIMVFKFFGVGPQLKQSTNQTPISLSQINSTSDGQSGNNSQSTSLSRTPNVLGADSIADSGLKPAAATALPDAPKVSPPADYGPKPAAAAAVPDTTKISPPADNRPRPPGAAELAPVQAAVSPPKNIDQPSGGETSAADQTSPTADLDLAKIPDVKRVQQRLIELGYLSGVADGVWGLNSKHALSDFRTAEKMGQDDHWDQTTEKQLFSSSTVRRQQNLAFVGGWAQDASSCANALVKITAGRATSAKATCDFGSIRQEADGKWRIQAHCELAPSLRTADTQNSWSANIKLTLEDRRLTWESEMGVEQYYRCSQ